MCVRSSYRTHLGVHRPAELSLLQLRCSFTLTPARPRTTLEPACLAVELHGAASLHG